ncbi:ABC transporter substrate-binding protein [Anaerovorax sp. IOR16]|uniref:ABC transporter substrate-binding protein n=1 Tax=Anaerovorax sp. IOR16 TaxID=2773458 RepID=UPI001FD6D46D|nr:ABC transporter substrate-binding protein [Anaerovorax sp. IOR16]
MKRLKIALILALALVLALTGCGGSNGDESGTAEKTTISFADVGWDSIKLNNALAGLVAEEVFGYTWQETPGSTPISHEALIKSEVDIHMEEWTNNIPSYAPDLEEGKFTELGINFDDNYQGFYIPRYVADEYPDLNSVQDLAEYPELFPDPEDSSLGIIYGGVTGWEITEIMAKKVELYGLDKFYNYFESGSDAILSAAMTSAWDKQEPIVAYYWEPTWLLGKYDFVLLDDEAYDAEKFQTGYGACPAVTVTIAVSNDFAATNPEYCEFLSRFKMSSAVISETLAYMNETNADYEEAAKWLLSEAHPELIEEWLDEEQATELKNTL